MAKQASTSLFSFRGFVEWITTVPLLASIFISNGRYLYDVAMDPIRIKLINLLTILTALVYNGVALFSYSESTFAHRHYTLLELLYMVSVTLSTVGYGGRIIIILLIGSSLSIIPALIADLLDTIRKKNYGGGCIKDESIPFILIIGTFTPEQVNDILDGFLSREISETHLSVVFLVVNSSLTEDLKMMERNSIWGHRIQFLHGSTLVWTNKNMCVARYAQAIFTMSDARAIDPLMEDEQNTARLWTLYCYTARHGVPLYSYNLDPSTAIYQKVAKEVICVGEFKQNLLAMNCRCPGVSTLLTNLLHQRRPTDNYKEPWQAQYDDGLCCEIYTSPAAEFILFAIKTHDKERGNNGILLNPGNSYTIKKSDLCIYIAENPKEIRDIDGLRTRAYFPTQTSNFSSTNATPTPSSPSSSSLSNSPSTLSFKYSIQSYRLSKLPTSRCEFLNNGRFLATGLGGGLANLATGNTKLPLCYLLGTPTVLDDAIFQSVDHLTGHILVCLHREVKNIFKFIYNLRTHHVAPEEIQDIVLLCSNLPDQKTFQRVNMFPRIYFGDCKKPEDLLRAGATRAKQIVIMRLEASVTNHATSYHQGRNRDSSAM
ncbi:calcium-activated BK potassium channel alpha subunit-domain-containing protein [Absidia repens]|uniref:Calcium-activated BK potassium channel alpha subunit-domain-containing protein n=1 Tax=Absidia repens TaxID=90262 RepID=A0A1X2I554_9FUNG|nr:calcium-activated BK potassium channel alpha subunit-domain-containing protein [Absidia repens]